MLSIRGRHAEPNAKIGKVGMGIVAPMNPGDRLGIDVAGFGFRQDSFGKLRFEDTLQRHEERGAVMAVPVRVAAWHDSALPRLTSLRFALSALGYPHPQLGLVAD